VRLGGNGSISANDHPLRRYENTGGWARYIRILLGLVSAWHKDAEGRLNELQKPGWQGSEPAITHKDAVIKAVTTRRRRAYVVHPVGCQQLNRSGIPGGSDS